MTHHTDGFYFQQKLIDFFDQTPHALLDAHNDNAEAFHRRYVELRTDSELAWTAKLSELIDRESAAEIMDVVFDGFVSEPEVDVFELSRLRSEENILKQEVIKKSYQTQVAGALIRSHYAVALSLVDEYLDAISGH